MNRYRCAKCEAIVKALKPPKICSCKHIAWELVMPTVAEQKNFYEQLGRYCNQIKDVLKEFMDLQKEEHYILVAIWIIGTYLHKQ